jgi:hypothetical protein
VPVSLPPAPPDRSQLPRREFLRRTALAGVALGLAPLAASAALPEPDPTGPPRVRRRVRLGRTGLEIPDIGFGSSSLSGDVALVQHALERGITYFDSAEGYQGGSAEETLGRALAGRREEVVLTSKTMTRPRTPWTEMMASLEGSLRRLRTDRVEIYFNHAVNDPARLSDAWLEFAARAKQQGKIRFTGMSGHGGRLVECVEAGLERDLFDVYLLAHNFGQDPSFHERLTRSFDFVARQPGLPAAMAKARQKGAGVVAMKTLRGARLNDLRPYETGGATFSQAALRWVLSQPHADALIVTMTSREQVDEYLGASGWTRPHPQDQALLERYEAKNGATQCRYGCGQCEKACPHGVPIADVLRTGMYARDYGDPALAREEYARLGAGASACLTCSGAPCAGACPFGLEISSLARDAALLAGQASG